MISEKLKFTQEILEDHPEARGDGNGVFLNIVYSKLHPKEPVDFTKFNTEGWTRSRRKVMELHPELDERTKHTDEVEAQVKREVA